MIYFMLKLRYISGDDPENENSKNKRKVKGIWLKKQRKQKILKIIDVLMFGFAYSMVAVCLFILFILFSISFSKFASVFILNT